MTDHRYMRFGGNLTRGTKFDESLPNIRGTLCNDILGTSRQACIQACDGGAFFNQTYETNAIPQISSLTGSFPYKIGFSANSYNAVYKDNSEIIPRSQVFVPIIKY